MSINDRNCLRLIAGAILRMASMVATLLGALVVLLLDSLSRSSSFIALMRGEFGAVHRLAFLFQGTSMSFLVVFVRVWNLFVFNWF